jgi:hypothetical protein
MEYTLERNNMNTDINDIREFKELKVNMNYSTGNYGENACRIVSKGSRLDQMYAQTYQEYLKISQEDYEKQEALRLEMGLTTQEWNERKEQERIHRDGSGEWILS